MKWARKVASTAEGFRSWSGWQLKQLSHANHALQNKPLKEKPSLYPSLLAAILPIAKRETLKCATKSISDGLAANGINKLVESGGMLKGKTKSGAREPD